MKSIFAKLVPGFVIAGLIGLTCFFVNFFLGRQFFLEEQRKDSLAESIQYRETLATYDGTTFVMRKIGERPHART